MVPTESTLTAEEPFEIGDREGTAAGNRSLNVDPRRIAGSWLPFAALFLVASAATAVEPWDAACSAPPAMAQLEEVIGPIPLAGEWRGRGFGDKRKVEAEIKECGRRIEGMVGVRLRGNVPQMVPLELDEDDGRYKASFTYSEPGAGAAVVVTWDLEVESESRLTGRMTIMGRGDNVEADLLKAGPSPDMTACECEAVKLRRDRLAEQLAEKASSEEVAPWGWTTDSATCAIELTAPDLSLPTQQSYEVVMRADWEGELIHHRQCCAAHQAGGVTSGGGRQDPAALEAEIAVLDEWLEGRCEEEND